MVKIPAVDLYRKLSTYENECVLTKVIIIAPMKQFVQVLNDLVDLQAYLKGQRTNYTLGKTGAHWDMGY